MEMQRRSIRQQQGSIMACEAWKEKLGSYLDGELPDSEGRAFDAHARTCPACASDALARLQLKRNVQVAGRQFTPSAEFRNRIQRQMAAPRRSTFRWAWVTGAAALALLLIAFGLSYRNQQQLRSQAIFTEIADLHVATLASASPVDVVSTDRHTVKPWFAGKIPFTFDLPDLGNSDFSLLGGRMTYLDHAPGAHLIYQVRKHRISVFIFPEDSLPALRQTSTPLKKLSFNMETWNHSGLRYFVISDAGPGDIDSLARLFKSAAQ